MELEAEVGKPLLERSKRNISLTGDGLRFVPFAGMKKAPSYLVWKKRPVQSPAVERFLELLSHAVSEWPFNKLK